MVKKIEGTLDGAGLKIALVQARFNDLITSKLAEGALDGLIRHGVNEKDITHIMVPGSFEVPIVAKKAAGTGKYDAVIALAAVIRGGTRHDEYIAAEMTKGIAQAALETGVPIVYGTITADSLEQAIERSGGKGTNRGFTAAETAIEIANVIKKVG
ncbi:MAG TPA: 6,7-dimethyl-8-ribityllumazine synthase [Firmicutes bacterium]|nr:6,7-dimethyl-8-ribityllumazine synthase [Bacillota bacterium]